MKINKSNFFNKICEPIRGIDFSNVKFNPLVPYVLYIGRLAKILILAFLSMDALKRSVSA